LANAQKFVAVLIGGYLFLSSLDESRREPLQSQLELFGPTVWPNCLGQTVGPNRFADLFMNEPSNSRLIAT